MRCALFTLSVAVIGSGVLAKDGRTYYDREFLERLNTKLTGHEWARQQAAALVSAAAWYARLSDAELWDFVPPPEQLRSINVCIGHDCPFCGPEITRKAGHYPWRMDRDRPFKVTCPLCERTFPENDFAPWNTAGMAGAPESGAGIVDRGLGWVGPDGRRYHFVSYYIFW